jgi:hypothetical protein
VQLIEVHITGNVFMATQKRQITQKLTGAIARIEGVNMRGVSQDFGGRRDGCDSL